MQDFESFDWSKAAKEAQLKMARLGTDDQLRALARSYNWHQHPERVLGWMMAQKCIDLGSAMTAFMNGEPERFNYMPKRDVPDEYRGAARLLDNICLRVNSGFYLVYPDATGMNHQRLSKWMTYQKADRAEGRRGRWILDENILEALMNDTLHVDEAAAPEDLKRTSWWRDLLSPVVDLATKRVVE